MSSNLFNTVDSNLLEIINAQKDFKDRIRNIKLKNLNVPIQTPNIPESINLDNFSFNNDSLFSIPQDLSADLNSSLENKIQSAKTKQIADAKVNVALDTLKSDSEKSIVTPTDLGKSFEEKLQSANNYINILDSLLPEANNETTAISNKVFDGVTNEIMKSNPLVGTAIKAGGFVSDAVSNLIGKTDGMTKVDQILDSKFAGPIGWINQAFGKKSDKFDKDDETFAYIGSGYEATEDTVDKAEEKANKKYGLFSNKKRKAANRFIRSAREEQYLAQDIANESKQDMESVESMSDRYSNRNAFLSQGGWNNRASVGKNGMKINQQESQQVVKLQEGTKNPKRKTIEELHKIALDKNPRFMQRLKEPVKYIEIKFQDGTTDNVTHLLGYFDDGLVIPSVQEINGKLTYFQNIKDALYNALKNDNYIKFDNKEDAELFTKEYKKLYPKFFDTFKSIIKHKSGGKMNVIPEGSLHARLHHMDIDGITKKGIPVVTKEGEEFKQQAEIECNEIIMRLEVTKKLEDLQKKYYSDNCTTSEKDKLAIEAGKLLVYELLKNTVDNTGLIKEIEV